MRKLSAVENARATMTEGVEWGIWKWMLEKKRVRHTADEARAALDELEKKVKATWSEELKLAYNQLLSEMALPARRPRPKQSIARSWTPLGK